MFNKNPRRNIFAVVGTLTFLTAGSMYLYNRTIIGRELTSQEAAKIVPEEAWMVTHISSDSRSWSKLTKFGSNKAKDMLDAELQEATIELSSNSIDYYKDVEPWLGNITIAKLPSDEGLSTLDAEKYNILAIIGIKNKLEAGMFINKLQDGSNSNEFQTRKYRGVTIFETKTQTNEPLNTALIGDRLIMASDPEIMNLAIDTMNGRDSFADRMEAEKLAKQNNTKEKTLFQIYIPDYADVVKTSLSFSPTSRMAARRIDKFSNIKSMMMWLEVNDNGLHFQALAKLNSPTNLTENQPIPDEMLSYLPANTIALYNGTEIDRTWSSFIAKVAKDRLLRYNLSKYKKSFETSTNLDLDKDVFSWMDGEFAMALVPPTNKGILADYGIAGMVIWTTDKRSQAENTLKKIEAKRASFNDILVEKRNVDGKEITEWKNLAGEDILSYTWLNDTSLLLKLGSSPDPTLKVKANNSVSKDKTFTKVTKYLPKNNQGYLYINNLEQIIPPIERFLANTPYSIEPEAQAALTSVEAIAVTTSQPSPSLSELDIFVSLKSD